VVIEVADPGVEVRLADDRGVVTGVAKLGDVTRQRARARHALVVVEAMKMENELRSTSDGVVRAVRVQPGEAVEKGTVLIELAES